ncbi:MAG: haloacid dehalogenase-like hydrolase [Deltaproteobacteria bacterium]|nr:haloacid dehalogenase-like hydrolase [Deltaproteobacteria bacterium]NND28505.1 haloacid dehalogenase-like hydrolase [Myxococcales bacterium]MBT8463173.1 haloacid dehalogenase-like hydrolase [Deltaproteobacteria bacterium]MBT8482372.1 haloacid dehalogenase-like hydrolase [Deltaproteobacteria bacterium]NNK07007.1 haloacid dehalogenase-like hydrolase [Myxococcales bacterium]
MKFRGNRARALGLTLTALFWLSCASSQTPGTAEPRARTKDAALVDPLPSWNDNGTKARIIEFVRSVTDPEDLAFVEPEDRVATFDNDGTLWVEQPTYTELAFALHRVRDLAKVHPEWKDEQPFKAVIEDDREALMSAGTRGMIEIVMASHTGMSTTLFETIVAEWLRDARHPTLEKPYTELRYQPQLELLRYLEAEGFKTFIVSGGTVEFIRTFSEDVYGIPRERVVGTSIETRYEVQGGKPTLLRRPEIEHVDDKAGKPVGIHQHIGRRPILAFGNSDGDFQMLEWTTVGSAGARLGLLLHHDDAEREYAYDRDGRVGKLDQALDAAVPSGWLVVSMKNDWNAVFAPQ